MSKVSSVSKKEMVSSAPLILVADDEPAMCDLIEHHLSQMGDEIVVVKAYDGEEAWKICQEQLPDLVILDVMMPLMSGWEVCRNIREDVATFAHTGVIMLTGIGEALNSMMSPIYKADASIDKPFTPAELEAQVHDVLEAKARLREAAPRRSASPPQTKRSVSKSKI